MARLVKRWTLDFGSGHDFTVCGVKPCVGLCAASARSLLGILSPFLSASPLFMCTRALSLKINKLKKRRVSLGACEGRGVIFGMEDEGKMRKQEQVAGYRPIIIKCHRIRSENQITLLRLLSKLNT